MSTVQHQIAMNLNIKPKDTEHSIGGSLLKAECYLSLYAEAKLVWASAIVGLMLIACI